LLYTKAFVDLGVEGHLDGNTGVVLDGGVLSLFGLLVSFLGISFRIVRAVDKYFLRLLGPGQFDAG
jgi:hypothetical protein